MNEPIESLISNLDALNRPMTSKVGPTSQGALATTSQRTNLRANRTINLQGFPQFKPGKKNRALTAHIKGGMPNQYRQTGKIPVHYLSNRMPRIAESAYHLRANQPQPQSYGNITMTQQLRGVNLKARKSEWVDQSAASTGQDIGENIVSNYLSERALHKDKPSMGVKSLHSLDVTGANKAQFYNTNQILSQAGTTLNNFMNDQSQNNLYAHFPKDSNLMGSSQVNRVREIQSHQRVYSANPTHFRKSQGPKARSGNRIVSGIVGKAGGNMFSVKNGKLMLNSNRNSKAIEI